MAEEMLKNSLTCTFVLDDQVVVDAEGANDDDDDPAFRQTE
jgi:hypothetical protein